MLRATCCAARHRLSRLTLISGSMFCSSASHSVSSASGCEGHCDAAVACRLAEKCSIPALQRGPLLNGSRQYHGLVVSHVSSGELQRAQALHTLHASA